ncbi:MAG: PilZ domain-containing protein [Nitrospira sp.]|nr:PilZ domain-containing protein [Nitrospira sp.]
MVSPMTDASSPNEVAPDNRREWVRIDDKLLLEYRLEKTGDDLPYAAHAMAVTPEMISAAVEKPTAELLERSGDVLATAALVPWLRKVDWLLEVILQTLAKTQPGSLDLARLTDVNISGGGISFISPQRFNEGDRLSLKMILPPFTPIQTVAKIVRSSSEPQGGGCMVAAEFVGLGEDDQEHLIRHILHTQAERVRAARRPSA